MVNWEPRHVSQDRDILRRVSKEMIKYFCIPVLLVHLGTPAYAASVQLPRTGQTTCYNASGSVIGCAHTGQDGDKQSGATLPTPRFKDNKDGTVTDNLTGLIWLKDANCTDTIEGVVRSSGLLDWQSALTWSNNLASGKCGLSDNSASGDWRLPNINELRSLVDYSRHDPALAADQPFINVQSEWYWSSTTNPVYTTGAYNVGLGRGSVHVSPKFYTAPGSTRMGNKEKALLGVWPVRDRK